MERRNQCLGEIATSSVQGKREEKVHLEMCDIREKSSLTVSGSEERKVRWTARGGRDEENGKERNGDRHGGIGNGYAGATLNRACDQ